MPKTIKEERLRWILPIFNKEIRLKDAAKDKRKNNRIKVYYMYLNLDSLVDNMSECFFI